MAEGHRRPATKVSSVRDGDGDPLLEQSTGAGLIETAADAAVRLHGERIGRIAVIADGPRITELFEELGSRPQLSSVGSGLAGIDVEIAVINVTDEQGLVVDESVNFVPT